MHHPEQETNSEASMQPLRVLIADDNEDAADMLAMILGSKGHEVRVAHDGLEAVSSAVAFLPDVALLDIGMPELDGHQVAAQIRRLAGTSVMLVAVTGWSEPGVSPAKEYAGFDHHLVKPIDLERLTECLSEQQKYKRERTKPGHSA
jgi:two-component system CheB/CheR fusion protein